MLDRSKLVTALQPLADKLFIDKTVEYEQIRELWATIGADLTFVYKINAIRGQSPWLLPSWQGRLDEVFSTMLMQTGYGVIAVDGSQIYPDRHQGAACYLINVGMVQLSYGLPTSCVFFTTTPSLFVLENQSLVDGSPESINCQREAYELQAGLEYGRNWAEHNPEYPYTVLFDGSLIFWHLDSKEQQIRDHFLGQYLATLQQCYRHHIPIASYISFPRSKELVNLLRMALCNFQVNNTQATKLVDTMVDAHVARFFLQQPGQRSCIFANHAPITQAYPDHLKPCFFYLNAGSEIVRIELPAWIAYDENRTGIISAIIMDQIDKGRGYPVCLAEAHEQAVVKGPDRDFFYHLLQRVGIEQKQRYIVSQKSLKKRGMGI
jgi:hypothetical protein